MRVGYLLAAAGLLTQPLAAAEDVGPLVLQPSSQWAVDYAEDSCRLSRTFGESKQQSALIIERYEPGDEFNMVLAGPFFTTRDDAKVFLRFGPLGKERDTTVKTGELGTYGPALIFSTTLFEPPSEADLAAKKANKNAWREPGDPAMFTYNFSAEDEAAISWLEIRLKKNQTVRLALGSMKAPMAALRTCTEELVSHWGIDVEAHRSLTRRAVPKANPGTWLSPDDYPTDLLRQGSQGIVRFRLSVGADGSVTDCHIQQSTRPVGFDEAVCRGLRNKAKFEPALDANGRPINSYWRSTVNFELL